MPGLAGIIMQNENSNTDILLSKMCQAIKHEKWHKIDTYIDKKVALGRVHLGIINSDAQPIFKEDKTLCILMEGEVYDYQDFKQELIHRDDKFSIENDPESIMYLFEQYGEEFVNKINGSFTLVIWNEKTDKLMIINDRYGLRPLYYSVQNGYLLFGSEVKAILQDETFQRKVDDKSVAEFFSFGYILGTKTLFQDIELAPPASIITYEKGQVSKKHYWDFKFDEEYKDYPENYYIEELSRLMLQSIERQMKGNHKIGVPLTGGFDSRTIVASINKKHYPIHTFTFGKRNCYDVTFAKMIAKKLGIPHHFFEFKPDDLVSYAEKAVSLTDGMFNIIHAHRMQTYDEMREFIDIALGGWIGDWTIGRARERAKDKPDEEDNLELFKNLVYLHAPNESLRNLFKDSYFKLIEKNMEISKNYVLKIGEDADIKYSNNRLMYYNLKERQRRFSLNGHILMRNSLEVRTPFSDYDFIDFILKIPPELKNENCLYKKFILTMFPHLANVPTQKTGLPIYPSRFQERTFLLKNRIINKINNKIKRKFGFKLFSDTEKLKEFYEYPNWMRNNKKLREYIFSILMDERTLKRPYFNQEYLKEILDIHISGKEDYSELIGRLVTFELWNRLFIDK